jgi:hypothetical protein
MERIQLTLLRPLLGWYGKFHMEMAFWHLAHWARWNRWSLFNRALPSIYLRFLPTSIERADGVK